MMSLVITCCNESKLVCSLLYCLLPLCRVCPKGGKHLRKIYRSFTRKCIGMKINYSITILVSHSVRFYSGALIKRKLKKNNPFRPIEFAQLSQERFIDVNKAIQRFNSIIVLSHSTTYIIVVMCGSIVL